VKKKTRLRCISFHKKREETAIPELRKKERKKGVGKGKGKEGGESLSGFWPLRSPKKRGRRGAWGFVQYGRKKKGKKGERPERNNVP